MSDETYLADLWLGGGPIACGCDPIRLFGRRFTKSRKLSDPYTPDGRAGVIY